MKKEFVYIITLILLNCSTQTIRLKSIAEIKEPSKSSKVRFTFQFQKDEIVNNHTMYLNGWKVGKGKIKKSDAFSIQVPEGKMELSIILDSVRTPSYTISEWTYTHSLNIQPSVDGGIVFTSDGKKIIWSSTILTWIPGIMVAAPLWIGAVHYERKISVFITPTLLSK
jgi:hypothetical protein